MDVSPAMRELESVRESTRGGAVRHRLFALTLTPALLACAPLGDDLAEQISEDDHEVETEERLEPIDHDREAPTLGHVSDQRRCFPGARPSEVTPVVDEGDPGPGSLRVRDPKGSGLLELPLQATRFDTIVIGTLAETEIVQVFANPLDRPIEALYLFPLHERAAVDDYSITIGARTIRGKVQTREQARETYEQAKYAGQTAGLLEQQRPNMFSQSLVNIAPGETIEVSMHVVQPLDQDEGRYTLTLPTVVGPRYVPPSVQDAAKISAPLVPEGFTTCAELEVSVLIDAGIRPRALRSQHHAIDIERVQDLATVALAEQSPVVADRDFQLSWELDGGAPQAAIVAQPEGEGGYFTMTIAPPDVVLDEEAIARELVFVVDTSGSMSGKPLDTAKAAMREALRRMRPDDAFAILGFDDNASSLSDTLLIASDDNIAKGLEFVDSMSGDGGTQMNAGITAALAYPRDPSRVRMVLFLTDGYIGNEADIFAQVERDIGDTRIFGLGVGGAPNRYLLDGLAAAGRGAVTYAAEQEEIRPVVDRFYDRIATPVLGELELDWGGLAVEDVLPAKLPDLFAGQPLTVYGRYQGKPQGPIVLRAKTKTGSIEIPVEFDLASAQESEGVGSMWARSEVDRLLGFPTQPYEGAPGYAEAKQAVIDLALEHRLLTQFTSFVAVDERKVVGADGQPQVIVQPLEVPVGTSHESFGVGGLGLVGNGRGGGGTGYGTIGLGSSSVIGRGGGGGTGYGYGSGTGFGGRGSKVPQVRQGKPTVTGSLDKDIIRRIVRAHINEVRSCYNATLVKDPTVAGKLSVNIEVGKDGKVIKVEILDDEIGYDFGKCVAKAAGRWTFPKAEAGFSFTYPFQLAPG